jgi:hypothetical protein
MTTCEMCGLVFESTWTDEEALAEAAENFGGPPPPGTASVVCDDCYAKAMAHAKVKMWPKSWIMKGTP